MISFLSVFPPFRGGIATFSHYLYRELSKRTEVHAYNYTNLYPDLLFPGKTQYAPDSKEDYAHPLLHSYNPAKWRQTVNIVAKDKPDLVIYSHWHPFFAPSNRYIAGRLKKKDPGLKIAGILHNVIPHEHFPFQNQLITSLFRKTDYPILLSDKTMAEFNDLQIDAKPAKLFHPVYDQPFPDKSKKELRKELNISEDEMVILFFGLIRKYKGLDLLIDALNKLDIEKRKIRPLIVGEFYTDKEEILKRIKEEHKNRYLIIDRFVTDEKLARYFTLSDVLALPYRSASQSGILSNAINFKLPVIVSNIPGLTEHVRNNETGLFFEKENIEDLKSQIIRFQDEQLATVFEPNLEKLKEELNWKTFCDRLLEATEYKTG